MIFYFSGTGNSRYAALKMAMLTNDRAFNIADIFKGSPLKKEGREDVTGFIFPVYFSGIPEMVKRFVALPGIKKILGEYVYCVITCGASAAAANGQIEKITGRKIDYTVSLKMPDNYVMAYNPCDKEEAKAIIKEADLTLNEISRSINKKKTNENNSFPKKAATALMSPLYNLFRTTLFFKTDDSCISCGRCASICPDSAIEMKDGKPEWIKEKCQHCTACINSCPQKAIQFTSLTKNRGRYYILNLNNED